MNEASIYDIAVFCHNRQKEIVDDCVTLYCAIFKDNSVLCSYTPHILLKEDVEQALLVYLHCNLIEYIDSNGCVHRDNLGNGFSFTQWSDQVRIYNHSIKPPQGGYYVPLYTCSASSFEEIMPKIWYVYCHIKDLKNENEINDFIGSLEKRK